MPGQALKAAPSSEHSRESGWEAGALSVMLTLKTAAELDDVEAGPLRMAVSGGAESTVKLTDVGWLLRLLLSVVTALAV